MFRRLIIAALLTAFIAVPILAQAADEKGQPAPQGETKPVISLKANMGGSNMELNVEQTDDGVAVKGTMDEKSVTATGKRQEDGSVKVEVHKDEETMVEMTINPDAIRGVGETSK